MSHYRYTLGEQTFVFDSLADVMAKATPARSGDRLAGVIAESAEQRIVAQMLLAEVPLKRFLYEQRIAMTNDLV